MQSLAVSRRADDHQPPAGAWETGQVDPAGEVGSSNSRSAFTKSTFGVDTVSLAFHGLGGSKVPELCDKALALRHGMGHLMLDKHPSGARVVWYPTPNTLKVEGRLAALATGDHRVKRLATRTELRELPDRAAEVCSDIIGIDTDELRQERHHLTRLDTTGELHFVDPADGLAMLQAATGLVPGGYKGQPIYSRDGRVETMYVITARRGRKVARFYNSSLHHRTGPSGQTIRYEVQNRWPKASDRTPAEMAAQPHTLPALFARHLEPFTNHAKEMVVSTALQAPELIARKIASGELTPRQASGMAGFVALLPYGGRHLYPDQAARRYLRLLNRHGIALTAVELESTLTVGQALTALLDGACEVSEDEA